MLDTLPDNTVHTCQILHVSQGRVQLRTLDGHDVLCRMNGVQSGAFAVAQASRQWAYVRLEISGREQNVFQADLADVQFENDARLQWRPAS